MELTSNITSFKVWASLGDAQKQNYWDLFEFLQHYEISEFLNLYYDKFSNSQMAIGIIKAFVYFEEAENDQDPGELKGETWESVKKFIQKKVSDYLK